MHTRPAYGFRFMHAMVCVVQVCMTSIRCVWCAASAMCAVGQCAEYLECVRNVNFYFDVM